MAKTFYSLDEAAKVLGKSTAEVQKMVESGALTEFKDGDQIVVRKDQVDVLADDGGNSGSGLGLADESGIGLTDALEPLSLESSGSGTGFSLEPDSGQQDEKESTGISIFDPEETEIADAAEQTQVTDAPAFEHDFAADSGSSGSGLLDLTREADDTSLGADLLDDVYGQDTVGGQTGVADSGGFGGGGELFETTGSEMETAGAMSAAAPIAAAAATAYDGSGSGLVGGLALGICVTTILALGVALLVMTGVTGGLVTQLGGNHFAVAGGLAVVTLLLAAVGWFLGRKD